MAILLLYLLMLLLVAHLATRATNVRQASSNSQFFNGGRHSPWMLVAFGMIGASVSGVSFVSVPGMVLSGNMHYLQMCLGFIPGYLIVAFLLLPLYYRMGGASIYRILSDRLGTGAHRTGALFFLISDLTGSTVKFYLVCSILQGFVFDAWGMPFWLTVPLLVLAIWLYTRQGGIRTLVFTDVLQTFCMIAALLLIIYQVCSALGLSASGAVQAVMSDSRSTVFMFDNWSSPAHFAKMFLSGAFTVVVMTGLNQNMMQKNLTCRTLPQAQKNMVVCGLLFTPVNALFLALGVLLAQLATADGQALQAAGDSLLPTVIGSGRLGETALALFTVGVASAAFSSADSSLTALTTTVLIDIVGRPDDVRLRRRVHLSLAMLLVLLVYALRLNANKSLIDVVYTIVGYTYGPLLALFCLAFTPVKRHPSLRFTLAVCLLAPALSYAISTYAATQGYHFGYELLLLNAALAYIPLALRTFRAERL